MNKRNHGETSSGGGFGVKGSGECSSSSSSVKAKMWDEEQDASGGMDELLAVLGYKVKASEMASVAEKLEQLEMVMGTTPNLSCDSTVHYNPSDLSGWVQSMLSELNNPNPNLDPLQPIVESPVLVPPPTTTTDSSAINNVAGFTNSQVDNSEYDLRAIPGSAVYPQTDISEGSRKRFKSSTGSCSLLPSSSSLSSSNVCEQTRPVVLVDSQETGVRLVHTLMACAEAVQNENLELAGALVKHISLLAASQAGAMRKVATYFAEALAFRIYRLYPQDCLDASMLDMLQMHFYETCPHLKFTHFTTNQVILQAFTTASSVHVIDFGLKQGLQWPALIQALALRPGGPSVFRLTGIGPSQSDNTDALQQVGLKLMQLAETIGIQPRLLL